MDAQLGELTLYELGWEKDVGPAFSPHSYKARLALVAKGAPFTSRYTTYEEMQGPLKDKTGLGRPRAPFLVLPDGTYLFDSLAIAQWLDRSYPDTPSVFLPSQSVPCDPTSTEYQDVLLRCERSLARWQLAWLPLQRLGLRQTAEKAVEGSFSKAYFKSNRKAGDEQPADGTEAWERAAGVDRAQAVEEGKAYLAGFAARLEEDGVHFLASDTRPGFEDFAVIGQWVHCALAADPDAMGCWRAYHDIVEWVERMLDAFDEHLRRLLEPTLGQGVW